MAVLILHWVGLTETLLRALVIGMLYCEKPLVIALELALSLQTNWFTQMDHFEPITVMDDYVQIIFGKTLVMIVTRQIVALRAAFTSYCGGLQPLAVN